MTQDADQKLADKLFANLLVKYKLLLNTDHRAFPGYQPLNLKEIALSNRQMK